LYECISINVCNFWFHCQRGRLWSSGCNHVAFMCLVCNHNYHWPIGKAFIHRHFGCEQIDPSSNLQWWIIIHCTTPT
jgi:hypothetical protein